jgi:trans-aconitate methyltransferase
MSDRPEHWNGVYARRAPQEVSWFQPEATMSLELIAATGVARDAPLIDVGAGASLLVDGLLAKGFRDITLLDVAHAALAETRRRLGPSAGTAVHYVVGDITTWTPVRQYALWHDRAVFHFLTAPSDRAAYRRALALALEPGAHAILATFALDGPERCSNLPVQRYSADALAAEFAGVLTPVEARPEVHRTPSGTPQSFVVVRFIRSARGGS